MLGPRQDRVAGRRGRARARTPGAEHRCRREPERRVAHARASARRRCGDRFHHAGRGAGEYRSLRARAQSDGRRHHRLVRRNGARPPSGRAGRHRIRLRRKLLLRREPVLPDRAGAAPALAHDYRGHITERHHIHKKDAPSGTAVSSATVAGAGVGRARRHHLRARRRGDRHAHAGTGLRRAIASCSPTKPSRAAPLPKAQCWPPSGSPARPASTTSRIFSRSSECVFSPQRHRDTENFLTTENTDHSD